MAGVYENLKFYKGCKYNALFYTEDDSGYRELLRTNVYVCVNDEIGYLEFAPAHITDMALAQNLYPTFIAKEHKDNKSNSYIRESAPTRFDFSYVEISSIDFAR